MLIYKFLNEKYGLEALRMRRIKISRINELNDPFEFLAPKLSDYYLRKAFHKMKLQMLKNTGLLCFSKMRTNPLLWSHYANRHQGICLGFNAPKEDLKEVIYTSKRPNPEVFFSGSRTVKEEAMHKLIPTKYIHWKYEKEWRSWHRLEEKDPKTGHYFLDFSDRFNLVKVIVGAESKISRKTIDIALGKHRPNIECFQARTAFNSFRIIQNKDSRLWK